MNSSLPIINSKSTRRHIEPSICLLCTKWAPVPSAPKAGIFLISQGPSVDVSGKYSFKARTFRVRRNLQIARLLNSWLTNMSTWQQYFEARQSSPSSSSWNPFWWWEVQANVHACWTPHCHRLALDLLRWSPEGMAQTTQPPHLWQDDWYLWIMIDASSILRLPCISPSWNLFRAGLKIFDLQNIITPVYFLTCISHLHWPV